MLSAEGLVHGFGATPVLDHVALTVKPGDRVGIAGPSGVGKTTLGRILAGQVAPHAGTVRWDGKPLGDYRGASPVQLAPQSPELAVDPRWTIAEVLDNGGVVDGAVLAALGIQPAWGRRRSRELSGGELARVSLARLLLPTTRVLICDEITTQLDALAARQIWSALLPLVAERDIALIVISHEDRLRSAVCTQEFTLSGGRLGAGDWSADPPLPQARFSRHPFQGMPARPV